MSKRKCSLILNLLLLALEIAGFSVLIALRHQIPVVYYTVDSNILALCSAALYTAFLLAGKGIPKWLQMVKYTATVCLSVTFLVVLLILGPMYQFRYDYLLLHEELLYQHLLCPVVGILAFLLSDGPDAMTRRENLLGISFTILYAAILTPLNILRIVTGPYPFLLVYEQPVWQSVLWLFLILALAYLIAFFLRKARTHISARKRRCA